MGLCNRLIAPIFGLYPSKVIPVRERANWQTVEPYMQKQRQSHENLRQVRLC